MAVKVVFIAVIAAVVIGTLASKSQKSENVFDLTKDQQVEVNTNPMSIESLKARDYPGSQIVIESELTRGGNYKRYIASYYSEGNKINGLLTIPESKSAVGGFPGIVFIHGYIPPNVYRTTERYVAYQDNLAKNGFITYKIDLRGHDLSEGEAVNGHYSEAYVVDTLNAISSMMKMKEIDTERIGLWGHSNGGEIGLRSMVVSDKIKAGVFWAGVVGSFEGMLEKYNSKIPFLNLEKSKPEIITNHGLPSQNRKYWEDIDPYNFLENINGPIQLHHGTADESVPIDTSVELKEALKNTGKSVEYYEYKNGDHNLGGSAFGPAMKRTVEFFKKNL